MAFTVRYSISGLQIPSLAPSFQEAIQSGAKMLPPALEDLHLACRGKEHFALLLVSLKEVMASVSEGKFKSLRSIAVEDEKFAFEHGLSFDLKHFSENPQSVITELEERGRQLSIQLQWVTRFTSYKSTPSIRTSDSKI